MFQLPRDRPAVNKCIPAERVVRLLTFALCAVAYAAVLVLFLRSWEPSERAVSVPSAVRLSFVQMELQAEPTPPPRPEPVEQEAVPELEEADVTLEKIPELLKPEPQPAPLPEEMLPEAPVAQVTQEAAAPEPVVSSQGVQGWAQEQLEKEKYMPRMAERMGLSGEFILRIDIRADGVIRSAEILEGRGHRILRQALEKMLTKIVGRGYGQAIGEPLEFEVRFIFE